MATFKAAYPADNNSITFSGLNSLANGGTVFSSAISNTTNLDLDDLVQGTFVTAASGVISTGSIAITIAGSSDGGTTFPTTVANCQLLAVVTANATSTTYSTSSLSVAALTGGLLPDSYKIGVTNATGAALASGGNAMAFSRISETVA